jgi:flagellar assembly protein FliH
LPAAGETMSSSRIIKYGEATDTPILEYQYEIIQDQPVQSEPWPDSDGFVPLVTVLGFDSPSVQLLCDVADEGNDAVEEECAETTEEVQVGISEDELLQRVQESYERGFEEGQRQAERGLANVFKSLREGISEVINLREQILRDCEEDLLKLSIIVARKIVHQEITQDRSILAKVVTAAIDVTSESDDIIVRLNPEDYKLVTSNKLNYLNGSCGERPLNLKPDEAVSFGGCIVDTVMGEIDARLETQLEEVHKRLMEERAGLTGVSHDILNDEEPYA